MLRATALVSPLKIPTVVLIARDMVWVVLLVMDDTVVCVRINVIYLVDVPFINTKTNFFSIFEASTSTGINIKIENKNIKIFIFIYFNNIRFI